MEKGNKADRFPVSSGRAGNLERRVLELTQQVTDLNAAMRELETKARAEAVGRVALHNAARIERTVAVARSRLAEDIAARLLGAADAFVTALRVEFYGFPEHALSEPTLESYQALLKTMDECRKVLA